MAQRFYSPPRGPVKRTQRYPQYTDEELKPFFEQVSKGYCVKQAAARCGYSHETIMNTLYSDDDTYGYVIDLSMVAGALIRSGKLAVPDRWDGLYDNYRKDEDVTRKTLKEWMQIHREAQGLTRKEAAAECGMTQQQYWALENTVDDPHLPNVIRICRFYNILINDICHPKVDLLE